MEGRHDEPSDSVHPYAPQIRQLARAKDALLAADLPRPLPWEYTREVRAIMNALDNHLILGRRQTVDARRRDGQCAHVHLKPGYDDYQIDNVDYVKIYLDEHVLNAANPRILVMLYTDENARGVSAYSIYYQDKLVLDNIDIGSWERLDIVRDARSGKILVY